ncbi:MAG TPA: inorganic phosphate transporter, partial [Fervidobacterium sp.]|nr:inorganic phosphate transporter [Fervidobacterium sp.]
VSTTHSIIGGMIGFGLVSGGVKVVYWSKLISIVLSWVISPIAGGVLAFLVFKLITVTILHRPSPLKAAKKVAPLLIGLTLFLISFLFSLTTLKVPYGKSIMYGSIFFVISALISWALIMKYASKNSNEYDAVESIFSGKHI